MHKIIRLLKVEDATTAVEYAVMLGLILVAIIGAIGSVGVGTGGMWSNNAAELNDAFTP